jgi:Na+/H+-dicarboxylate symporter
MAYASNHEPTFFGLKLWQQVILGLALGIAFGFYIRYNPEDISSMFGMTHTEFAERVKVFGTLFIKLIKMVVAPLIMFALISGITSLTGAKDASRIGIKGAAAYLLTAVLAVIFGLTIATIDKPGVGIDKSLTEKYLSAGSYTPPAGSEPATIGTFLINLIPANIFNSVATDNYLQIVIFAIFTGLVMMSLGEKVKDAKNVIDAFARVTFRMIELIVQLAPIAIFSFMSWMVATMGIEVIKALLELVILVILACFLQYLFFGVLILVFARINPLPFYKKMFTTQLMAFSTSSSKATLSTAMRELQEKLGTSESTTNFMMPLGASINMDGTAIYLGICAVFFSQLYGIELAFEDYLMLVVTCTLGSIGAAGIPSGSIIFMGMVLHSVGLPLEGIGIILGIDRVLDMFRTTINITGDAAITLIIDKTEGKTDMKVYNS